MADQDEMSEDYVNVFLDVEELQVCRDRSRPIGVVD